MRTAAGRAARRAARAAAGRASASQHDVERAAGPAVLLLEVGGAGPAGRGRPRASREVDAAPVRGQPDRGGEVLGDRVGGHAADRVDRLGPQQEVGAADERRVVRGLAGAQQPVEQRLLVVGPAGHRVVPVAVELAGLHPADVRVGERRGGCAGRSPRAGSGRRRRCTSSASPVAPTRCGRSRCSRPWRRRRPSRVTQRTPSRSHSAIDVRAAVGPGDAAVVADHDGDLGVRVLARGSASRAARMPCSVASSTSVPSSTVGTKTKTGSRESGPGRPWPCAAGCGQTVTCRPTVCTAACSSARNSGTPIHQPPQDSTDSRQDR